MNALAFIGFALQLVGICLWAGGLLFYVAIAAPVALRELGNRIMAADCLAACLRRFHSWEAIGAVLNLCGAGFLYVAPVASPLLWLDVAVVVLMFLVFAFYAGYLMPRIDSLRIELHEADTYTRDTHAVATQSFLMLTAWYNRLLIINVALSAVLLLTLTGLALQCGSALPSELDLTLFGGAMPL